MENTVFSERASCPESSGCCAWVAPTMPSGTRSALAVPPAHFAFAESAEVAPVLFSDASILIWGVAELLNCFFLVLFSCQVLKLSSNIIGNEIGLF